MGSLSVVMMQVARICNPAEVQAMVAGRARSRLLAMAHDSSGSGRREATSPAQCNMFAEFLRCVQPARMDRLGLDATACPSIRSILSFQDGISGPLAIMQQIEPSYVTAFCSESLENVEC